MATINATYQVYAGGRWLSNVTNLNDYAGIYGTPIQGVYASLSSGNIIYRTHTQCGSWLSWVTNRSDYAGILGKNVDGLQMKVNGLSGYNVRYRAYVSGSWLPWVNGTEDYAGIYGQAISGIQVEIFKSETSNFSMSDFLSYVGKMGIFLGHDITFTAIDQQIPISIISLVPKVTVYGEVSLTEKFIGPYKSIDRNAGAESIANSFYNDLINKGITLGFSKNTLTASLKSLTLNSQINRYIKYSIQILSDGTAKITLEASFAYTSSITGYQRLIVTIEPNSYPYVTVPVVSPSANYDFNISFTPLDSTVSAGLLLLVAFCLYMLKKQVLGCNLAPQEISF